MDKSSHIRPATLLAQMAPAVRARFGSDSRWAAASGLPKETLSRLRKKSTCDLRTLGALAQAAGCTLAAVPRDSSDAQMPATFDREYEESLLALCASGNTDATLWRAQGPAFFMGGLAVLMASARGFDREKYLRLAESLHPGVSTPEVFAAWLDKSPVRAARFLPMARRRKGLA